MDAAGRVGAVWAIDFAEAPQPIDGLYDGSPFTAEATLNFLHTWAVFPLFSPPQTPRYNGSIEAGIGSLKTRTERQATQHGRPTCWTCDDAAAAQAEANATARPQGPTGPTPDELWQARRSLTREERTLLHASVDQQRHEVRVKEGWPTEGPLTSKEARTVDRQAIRRALEKHGYLLYARRTIPLPFPKKKMTAGAKKGTFCFFVLSSLLSFIQ